MSDISDSASSISVLNQSFESEDDNTTQNNEPALDEKDLMRYIRDCQARINHSKHVLQTTIKQSDIDYLRNGKLPSPILLDIVSVMMTLLGEKTSWYHAYEKVIYNEDFYERLISVRPETMTIEHYRLLRDKITDQKYSVDEVCYYPTSIRRYIRWMFSLLDWYCSGIRLKKLQDQLDRMTLYCYSNQKKMTPQPMGSKWLSGY